MLPHKNTLLQPYRHKGGSVYFSKIVTKERALFFLLIDRFQQTGLTGSSKLVWRVHQLSTTVCLLFESGNRVDDVTNAPTHSYFYEMWNSHEQNIFLEYETYFFATARKKETGHVIKKALKYTLFVERWFFVTKTQVLKSEWK